MSNKVTYINTRNILDQRNRNASNIRFKDVYSDQSNNILENIIKLYLTELQAKRKFNKGYRFEDLVALGLRSSGIIVTKYKYPETESDIEKKIVKTICTIIKSYNRLNKVKKLRKISNKENVLSHSGDFINNNVSISCKSGTNVVKHPQLGKVFSILTNQDVKIKLKKNRTKLPKNFFYGKKYLNKFRELSHSEGDTVIAEEFSSIMFKNLKKTYKGKTVLDCYNFLLGTDKPFILKLKEPEHKIEVINLYTIPIPESVQISYANSKITLTFSNGIVVSQRIKRRISKNKKAIWFNAYKEEWTLKPTSVIIERKKIFEF